MIWQALINTALERSGAIYPGQAFNARIDKIGFEEGSFMLSAWSRDGVLPPALVEMNGVLNTGQYEYEAGPGKYFPMRPLELDSVIIWGADLGNVRLSLRLETWTNWRTVSQPQLQATPTMVTMNPSFPAAKIIFSPAPYQAYNVSIAGKFAWSQILGQRAEEAILPPGFDDTFCDCLADKIATRLKINTPEIKLTASTSYKNLLLSLPYWDAVQGNPRVGVLNSKPAGDPWSRFLAGLP